MMISIDLTKWELERLLERMGEGSQEHVDRDLMEKLWRAQRLIKKQIEHPSRK